MDNTDTIKLLLRIDGSEEKEYEILNTNNIPLIGMYNGYLSNFMNSFEVQVANKNIESIATLINASSTCDIFLRSEEGMGSTTQIFEGSFVKGTLVIKDKVLKISVMSKMRDLLNEQVSYTTNEYKNADSIDVRVCLTNALSEAGIAYTNQYEYKSDGVDQWRQWFAKVIDNNASSDKFINDKIKDVIYVSDGVYLILTKYKLFGFTTDRGIYASLSELYKSDIELNKLIPTIQGVGAGYTGADVVAISITENSETFYRIYIEPKMESHTDSAGISHIDYIPYVIEISFHYNSAGLTTEEDYYNKCFLYKMRKIIFTRDADVDNCRSMTSISASEGYFPITNSLFYYSGGFFSLDCHRVAGASTNDNVVPARYGLEFTTDDAEKRIAKFVRQGQNVLSSGTWVWLHGLPGRFFIYDIVENKYMALTSLTSMSSDYYIEVANSQVTTTQTGVPKFFTQQYLYGYGIAGKNYVMMKKTLDAVVCAEISYAKADDEADTTYLFSHIANDGVLSNSGHSSDGFIQPFEYSLNTTPKLKFMIGTSFDGKQILKVYLKNTVGKILFMNNQNLQEGNILSAIQQVADKILVVIRWSMSEEKFEIMNIDNIVLASKRYIINDDVERTSIIKRFYSSGFREDIYIVTPTRKIAKYGYGLTTEFKMQIEGDLGAVVNELYDFYSTQKYEYELFIGGLLYWEVWDRIYWKGTEYRLSELRLDIINKKTFIRIREI